jgi:subtilisin family serine protease
MSRLAMLLLLFTPSTFAAEFITPKEPVPDRFIVVLDQRMASGLSGALGVAAVEGVAKELAALVGGKVLHTYGGVLGGFAIQARRATLEPLLKDARVAFIEQDSVMRKLEAQRAPGWGLDRIDQAGLPLDRSYQYAGAGEGVRAYIVDTGVRATHQEFAGRIEPGFNAAKDRGSADTSDCQGHGTHVAGTVAGSTSGVAKKARIVPVRVLGCDGSGTNIDVIAGLDWVAKNARGPSVVNMSLGGGASKSLDATVRDLVARGIPVVAAAGNENVDACNSSPARAPDAITVAASDKNDARASFSNKGRCVDLFAPGHGIGSASHQSDTGSRTLSGTSMATPHVAGAVAIYLGAHPKAKPADVASALLNVAVAGRITDAAESPNKLLQVTGLADAPAANPPPPASSKPPESRPPDKKPPESKKPEPEPEKEPDPEKKKDDSLLCRLGIC